MKRLALMLFIFVSAPAVCQTFKENYLYYLGSYQNDSTSYQVGLHINVIKEDSISLKVVVAENWKTKGEKEFYLNLDLKSVNKDKYQIRYMKEKYPAYKFVNEEGIVLLIIKKGNGLAHLKIPPDLVFGINPPEIFHLK